MARRHVRPTLPFGTNGLSAFPLSSVLAAVIVALLVFRIGQWSNPVARQIVFDHLRATVGLPIAGVFDVFDRRAVSQHRRATLNFPCSASAFEGAAGPIVMWVFCAFSRSRDRSKCCGDNASAIVAIVIARAQIGGRSVEEVRAEAMAAQSIKAMIDPTDIAALAVFLASDAAKSISGQVLPIDNDRQRA